MSAAGEELVDRGTPAAPSSARHGADLRAELGEDAVDRLLAAGHDLKALTDGEQVTYLRWLYRKFDFDPRQRYIILVDGPSGRGEWRREAFLTKAAIDLLRQRHRVRLTDVGTDDLQHAVVHTVRASAPGHRAADVQGFAPRNVPDGTIDPYAYAKARAAARRTAVRELTAVSLSAYDDLDQSKVRVVDVGPLGAVDGGAENAGADAGLDAPLTQTAAHGAGADPAPHAAAAADLAANSGRSQGGFVGPRGDLDAAERVSLRDGNGPATGGTRTLRSHASDQPRVRRSAGVPDAVETVSMVRAFTTAATAIPSQPALATPQRGRPWDARSEFADRRAITVLRALAIRKVRTVHDERTLRHWLGHQTQLPFAERDPADLSAADVEMLTRHLSTLPDVGTAKEMSRMEYPPTTEDPSADQDLLVDHAALSAAALAISEPQHPDPGELER